MSRPGNADTATTDATSGLRYTTSSPQPTHVAGPVRHEPERNATGGLYCPLCRLQWPCFQADPDDTTDWNVVAPPFRSGWDAPRQADL